jgi:hypothetical protein
MKGRSKRAVLLALLGFTGTALLLPLAVGAQEVGRIAYLEGRVEIVRDGTIRSGFDVSIGDSLRELDLIQTGGDGYVEIELVDPAGSVVRVFEDSAYYLEVTADTAGNEVARLKLLTGTLEVAVNNVSRRSRLDVETRGAVFGVRGTEFDVLTAPDESVLLGVREGTVAAGTQGSSVTVSAGSAAERTEGGSFRQQQVPNGDFEGYYDRWTAQRLEVFRAGAPVFVRAYAGRYLDSIDSFRAAHRELQAFRPRLENAARSGSSLGSDMLLRQEISPAIIRMRSILPIFENTVYRLRELSRFHAQGIGVTSIGSGTSRAFFERFAMQEGDLLRDLGEVRYLFRLYGQIEERSFGGLPGGESPFGTSGTDFLDSMQF